MGIRWGLLACGMKKWVKMMICLMADGTELSFVVKIVGNSPVTVSCDWAMYTNLLPWLPCSLVIQKSSLSIKDDNVMMMRIIEYQDDKLISYGDDRKVERRVRVL